MTFQFLHWLVQAVTNRERKLDYKQMDRGEKRERDKEEKERENEREI